MKTTLPLTAAALFLTSVVHAGATLYQHGRIVPVAGATLENGSLLLVDGQIRAIGNALEAPAGATVIDLHGRWLTPALFGGIGSMGVVEISNEPTTNDSGLHLDEVRPEFDPALAFNPDSEPVEIARVEGVGFALLAPEPEEHTKGGNVIAGLADVVTLDGQSPKAPTALVVEMGHHGGTLAGDNRAAAFLLLSDAFEETRHPPRPGEPRRLTEAGRATLRAVLSGRLPVLFHVDRAVDIRAVLHFAAQQKIRALIGDGDEAWRVAKDLAKAQVAVVIDPFADLPANFDSISATLENAARLAHAGVQVAFSLRANSPHEVRRLRQGAGIAVAHGLRWEQAFAAITAVPAGLFGVGSEFGSLAVGSKANLIVWTGDPLEVTSRVEAAWLNGEERTLSTRQTALRDRYLEKLRRGEAR